MTWYQNLIVIILIVTVSWEYGSRVWNSLTYTKQDKFKKFLEKVFWICLSSIVLFGILYMIKGMWVFPW